MFSLISLQWGHLRVGLSHVMSWVRLHQALAPKLLLCKTGKMIPRAHKIGRTETGRDVREWAQCPPHSSCKHPLAPAPVLSGITREGFPRRHKPKWEDALKKLCCSSATKAERTADDLHVRFAILCHWINSSLYFVSESEKTIGHLREDEGGAPEHTSCETWVQWVTATTFESLLNSRRVNFLTEKLPSGFHYSHLTEVKTEARKDETTCCVSHSQ